MIQRKVTWTEFKDFINGRDVQPQWVLSGGNYTIYVSDGAIIVETGFKNEDPIPQDSDLEDFVNNYKNNWNVNVKQALKGASDNTPIGNMSDALKTVIQGGDGEYTADVLLREGVKYLQVFGVQAIESLRGFDPIADTWFYIGTELDSKGAGQAGDTVRVQIAAGDDLVKFPAIDVTITLTASEANDETALANLVVSNLNADTNFSLNYFARRLDEQATTVYITARQPGPAGERPNLNDFQVSSTGTTVVTRAFDRIERRNKITSLARDPANPTLGVLGISGSVTAGEGDVTGRIIEFAEDINGSSDLRVNGSINNPQSFRIEASPDKERFITSLRFEALGNGIQFTNFLSQNKSLDNGILITIRSNDSQITLPEIKNTEDFASFFSRGDSDFDVYDVSGTDYFRATLSFAAPFQLFKKGTFAQDDFIEIQIRDNLNSGLRRFQFIAFGFEREF